METNLPAQEPPEAISFAVAQKTPFKFFQKLFIVYLVFSIVGHYGEVIWAEFIHLVSGGPLQQHIIPNIIPTAAPYGLGAIAVIMIVWPLVKKHKAHPTIVLLLNIIIVGIVEYVCAAVIVLFTGHNYFWDYSDQPFNLDGYICLGNTVIFGVAATLFIYFFYPLFKRTIEHFSKQQINAIFWVSIIAYTIDTFYGLYK